MFAAAGPFWPCVTSNETFWPSFSDLKPVPWIELWWANRSLPPSSGVMKPKPLESLNHFTVPVGMSFPLLKTAACARLSELRFGHDGQGSKATATRDTALGGGRRSGVHCLHPAARNVARLRSQA